LKYHDSLRLLGWTNGEQVSGSPVRTIRESQREPKQHIKHDTVFEYTTNLMIKNNELFLKMQDVKEWLQQTYKSQQFPKE
jgi:hypothetical protein